MMTCTVTNITEVKPENEVKVYNEEIWSNPDVLDDMDPFLKAKLLSERIAFDFV